MISQAEEGKVQYILRQRFPRLGDIRAETKSWTLEHFDYAQTRIDTDVPATVSSRRSDMIEVLNTLRTERVAEIKESMQHEIENARHTEVVNISTLAAKYAFWALIVAIVSVVIALIAWIFPKVR